MSRVPSIAPPRSTAQAIHDEAVGLLAGIGFTFALFFAVAHIENVSAPEPAADIEQAKVYTVPFEPPPPAPEVAQPVPAYEGSSPLSGIDIGASDSPVAIAVVPPDLEKVIPAAASVAPGRIQPGLLHIDLKPSADLRTDIGRVYQEAEVDQKPRPLVRTVPVIPADVSANVSSLAVVLLLTIDQQGRVQSARVLQGSGSAKFDAIWVRTVNAEWLYSPAMKRGKRVRILLHQPIRMIFSAGSSPFSIGS